MFVNNYEEIQWDALTYLIAEVFFLNRPTTEEESPTKTIGLY